MEATRLSVVGLNALKYLVDSLLSIERFRHEQVGVQIKHRREYDYHRFDVVDLVVDNQDTLVLDPLSILVILYPPHNRRAYWGFKSRWLMILGVEEVFYLDFNLIKACF